MGLAGQLVPGQRGSITEVVTDYQVHCRCCTLILKTKYQLFNPIQEQRIASNWEIKAVIAELA